MLGFERSKKEVKTPEVGLKEQRIREIWTAPVKIAGLGMFDRLNEGLSIITTPY